MKCPYCKAMDDRVVDTREVAEGDMIRRRRECLACGKRYTTMEKLAVTPVRVVKKKDQRELFDREKILKGMIKACEKRKVDIDTLEEIAADIENHIYANYEKEVSSSIIGELVMQKLQQLDQVAYVRFASVYKEFKSVEEFMKEITTIFKDK